MTYLTRLAVLVDLQTQLINLSRIPLERNFYSQQIQAHCINSLHQHYNLEEGQYRGIYILIIPHVFSYSYVTDGQ